MMGSSVYVIFSPISILFYIYFMLGWEGWCKIKFCCKCSLILHNFVAPPLFCSNIFWKFLLDFSLAGSTIIYADIPVLVQVLPYSLLNFLRSATKTETVTYH
jgi:hypothetical protein